MSILGISRGELTTFWALFCKEMTLYKREYSGALINSFCWLIAVLVPGMFFLPKMGMADDFCMLLVPGGAISWAFFDIMPNTVIIMSDLEGNRSIEYDLILPIRQSFIFLKIILVNASKSFLVSIVMVAFGALMIYLGRGFIFSEISFLKTLVILIAGNLFFASGGLWLASLMTYIFQIRNIWMRILMPLWWIGGFNSTWKAIYSFSPTFARLCLLNPMVYASEGIRAAALGQEGYISYWVCLAVLTAGSILFTTLAIRGFKRRLDCL